MAFAGSPILGDPACHAICRFEQPHAPSIAVKFSTSRLPEAGCFADYKEKEGLAMAAEPTAPYGQQKGK